MQMEPSYIGTRLAERYEVLSPLGAGGMGVVYRGKDLRLGRDVAIKVLPEHLLSDQDAAARFQREGKVLAALSHPNIVTIYDFGTDQNVLFAVTELLEGSTLRESLHQARLSRHKALEIAIAVADGIAAAHSREIVHRDIKPENIFLTNSGGTKILDFGLARLGQTFREGNQSIVQTITSATAPGQVMGTIQYMSPEQVRGKGVDVRTDIFSFGCVLYEMFTGSRPFRGNTPADVMAGILKEEPPELQKSSGIVGDDILSIIRHCLKKKPDDRFQSARDLAFSLKSLLTGSANVTPEVPKLKRGSSQRKRRTVESIAVLPLSNASDDPELEYFSDGITESLINSLSQIPKLRVMARSTVFRYKGKETDPLKVGHDLNVRAVLTGRVICRSERLNLQAELVDTEDGSQLWGEQYNRRLSDVFSMQEEISEEISAKLRSKLSGDEKSRIKKRFTESAEAYQLYLKGRFYWNKRTEEGLKKGIEYFQNAIQQDPGYALAYAGLADSYNLLSAYGLLSPKESVPLAKAAATKALELDSVLAEAHEALAHVKMLYDWDWPGAEMSFERAIKLNPNYATAHQRYAIFLAAIGRLDEALQEIDKAQKLDPLSLIINTDVALIHYFRSEYDSAIEQAKKALELDPNFPVAHFSLALAYEQKGEFDRAIDVFEQGITLSGYRAFISSLAHTYALAGRREDALRFLDELTHLSHTRYVPPYRFAIVYCGLGDFEQAFASLEKTVEERSVWLIHVHLRVDPRFAAMRSNPRFAKLLEAMDLPGY